MHKEEQLEVATAGEFARIEWDQENDKDFVDGRCIRFDIFLENIMIYIKGKELDFDYLNERNQKRIMGIMQNV